MENFIMVRGFKASDDKPGKSINPANRGSGNLLP
jgi:hypothetical protein